MNATRLEIVNFPITTEDRYKRELKRYKKQSQVDWCDTLIHLMTLIAFVWGASIILCWGCS